jgi:hypothetical protein
MFLNKNKIYHLGQMFKASDISLQCNKLWFKQSKKLLRNKKNQYQHLIRSWFEQIQKKLPLMLLMYGF